PRFTPTRVGTTLDYLSLLCRTDAWDPDQREAVEVDHCARRLSPDAQLETLLVVRRVDQDCPAVLDLGASLLPQQIANQRRDGPYEHPRPRLEHPAGQLT